jgi:hypothetical protein
VSFSGDDLRSHERGYPALLDIANGLPVGALVFASNAVAGDIWLPNGQRVEIEDTHIIGRRRRRITPAPRPIFGITDARFDRQVRVFGDAGQTILGNAKIAIIGLGGVGALLAEYPAHLGIGYFILIDPDRIEETNLPRVVYATHWHARTWFTHPRWPEWVRNFALRSATPKVDIAASLIRRINKLARIEPLHRDVLEPDVAAKLMDCDYIFLAADSMRARLLFNAIVHQYLIPGVQVGSKVVHDHDSGEITGVHSIVRPVTPDCGCLWCNQLINRGKLQEEAQTERERGAQRYVEDANVAAPSVITLNSVGASQAANDFMFYMTGLTADDASMSYMRFDPRKRGLYLDKPRRSPDCTECGDHSGGRLARGDLGKRLPTFQR